ncbi:MAG: zinc-binding dehydrogenase [Candidatus Latescibacterota bacterium]
MKAVRLIETGRPLEMQDIPVPEIHAEDVLVRVMAAGICHSDAHYRSGVSKVYPLPRTLGHEVSGVIEKVGSDVTHLKPGDRVCLHYLVTCGDCYYCQRGTEQFCTSGKMIGKHCDGGYAECIAVPARNAFILPSEIPFEQGAVMMCSSATSLHAIRVADVKPGESVAVFGAGGLGLSAVQIARAFGAMDVFAVDIDRTKLDRAAGFGAIPVDAGKNDAAAEIMKLTGGRGVDVSLELIGLPLTMRQAVLSLAIGGRAALVGLTEKGFEIFPYHEVINKEARILGVSDHMAWEIPLLIDLVKTGCLRLADIITGTVPLDAYAVNGVLDNLDRFGGVIRTVIKP